MSECMLAALRVAADPVAKALWQRIVEHAFEESGQGLDFTRRLAREQGWSLSQARATVLEYRKFCFLQSVQPDSLTPSEAVDQVWHLHLTYTQDYWKRWCATVLHTELHHTPTSGGRSQELHFRERYAFTLALYEQYFGAPPEQWWPSTAQRFAHAGHWRWLDTSQVWLVPRPRIRWRGWPRKYWSAVAATLMLALPATAVALGLNPLNWPAAEFLTLYVVGAVVLLFGVMMWRPSLVAAQVAHGKVSGHAQLQPLELAFLAGGRQRVIDTCVTSALAEDVLHIDSATGRLQRGSGTPAAEHLELVLAAGRSTGISVAELATVLAPLVRRIEDRLVQRGLCLSEAQAQHVAHRSSWPMLAWLVLGVAKIFVGIVRDKPVGFLMMLCLVVGVIVLVQRSRRERLSVPGQTALAGVRAATPRVQRAPQRHELPLAVALVGTSILAGSAFADWHRVQQQHHAQSGGSDSGSSSSDSSSDSSDSGGSGCGGCGGGD